MRLFIFHPVISSGVKARFPAVAVFTEIYQVTAPITRFCRQIAGHWYIDAACSSYHEFMGPDALGYTWWRWYVCNRDGRWLVGTNVGNDWRWRRRFRGMMTMQRWQLIILWGWRHATVELELLVRVTWIDILISRDGSWWPSRISCRIWPLSAKGSVLLRNRHPLRDPWKRWFQLAETGERYQRGIGHDIWEKGAQSRPLNWLISRILMYHPRDEIWFGKHFTMREFYSLSMNRRGHNTRLLGTSFQRDGMIRPLQGYVGIWWWSYLEEPSIWTWFEENQL